MFFSSKVDLLNYINSSHINIIDIINHIYYMKRTNQLGKYNFTNDEIVFLENKFLIKLDIHNK